MAQWNENPSWTPFEQINGGNRFERRLSAEDLNTLAENIAYLKSIGVTGDATAKEFTVVEGLTYYANNQKHTGTMRHFRNIGYTNLYLKPNTTQNVPDGYFDIYARSGDYFYVPPTLSFENLEGEAIASIQEANLISTNIKKGINIFGLIGSYEGSTIGKWQEYKVYNPNDIVIYNNIYYICIKTTQGGWENPENTPTEWERLNGSYKGTYNEAESYNVGDIVEKNGSIYQANRDNPMTPPDSNMAGHWTELYLNENGGGESLVTLSGSYMLGGNGLTSNTNYGVHPYTFNIKEAVSGTVNGSAFDYIEVSGCGGDSCPEQPFTSIKFTDASGNLVDSFMSYDLANSGVGITVHSDTRVTALFYSVLTGMMA